MQVAPADHLDLRIYRLVLRLSPTTDNALPLRLMSLIHRRGVPILEIHFQGADTTTDITDADLPKSLHFFVLVRSTEQRFQVLRAGLESVIGVLEVDVETTHL